MGRFTRLVRAYALCWERVGDGRIAGGLSVSAWSCRPRKHVDAINTFRVSAGRFTYFALFHVINFSISAGHADFRAEFDSRQLHWRTQVRMRAMSTRISVVRVWDAVIALGPTPVRTRTSAT